MIDGKSGDGTLDGGDVNDSNWRPPIHIIPDSFEGKCNKCRSLVDSSKVRTSGIIMAALHGMHYGTKYSMMDKLTCSRIENQVKTWTGKLVDRPVKLHNSCGLFEISRFYNPEIRRG